MPQQNQEANPKNSPSLSHSYKIKAPGVLRILFAVALFGAELAFFSFLAMQISSFSFWIIGFLQLLALIFALYLWQNYGTNSYNMMWIIMILFFPIFGLMIYFFWGRKKRYVKQRTLFNESLTRLHPYRKDAMKSLEEIDRNQLSTGSTIQLQYLAHHGFALYTDTKTDYFPSGESQFVQMFQDMNNAVDYIFMEYFILSDGHILDQAVSIMSRKAQEGLDVRLLYDDFGTTARVNSSHMKQLRESGVKIINFNPVLRYASGLYKNYRNHQKVCLIDGRIAWLGGTNLADEYANIHTRFGYWKDTAIRLTGNACRSVLCDFMVLWEHDRRFPLDSDYAPFIKETPAPCDDCGVVVPYWDGPFGNEDDTVADVFRSMFATAKKSIYIVTPYFILEHDLINVICQAAESGVDVNLITPGIPDKPQVYIVTRSNYKKLLESGCKVYEYTPGFIHAKTVLVDGERAVLGSVNLDFRSLYLNFENAVYIYNSPVLKEVKEDIIDIIAESEEITYEKWKNRPLLDKIKEPFFKTFSPLI